MKQSEEQLKSHQLNIKKLADGIKILAKQARESVPLNQENLASYSGLYPYQISKLFKVLKEDATNEEKSYNPTIGTVSNILDVFDMDLEEFFVWYNEMTKER